MIKFPNSECYLVTYGGGTCGGLVTTILTSLVLDKDILATPSVNGDSHDGQDVAKETWDTDSRRTYYQNNSKKSLQVDKDNLYFYIRPTEIESPIILFEHKPIDDYNTLAKIYPKFKQIVITFESDDCSQINYNLFTKLICHHFDIKSNEEPWTIMKKEFLSKNPVETWINQYDDPNDILKNKEHLKIFAKSAWPKLGEGAPLSLGRLRFRQQLIPNFSMDRTNIRAGEFCNRIVYIKFMDIIKNPDIVLSQIATITGKDITLNAKKYYDDWLQKQIFVEDIRGT